MQSKAKTPTEYLASLPPDRKKAITIVRSAIKKALPKGYKEVMQYGMITYTVPLSMFPQGYRGQKDVPLPFLSLGSQKNYMALYMMCLYGSPSLKRWFEAAWKKAGKKLDMGMGCVRFKQVDDLALDVLGETLARVPVATFIKAYQSARKGMK